VKPVSVNQARFSYELDDAWRFDNMEVLYALLELSTLCRRLKLDFSWISI
jgi:hypothetical protein